MDPFSQADYNELDLDEYRRRFPVETLNLSDEQIWNVVFSSEDDHDDAGWSAAFKEAQTS